MVLSTGGGYYPIYLAVSLGVLTVIALLRARPAERTRQINAAAQVALFATGLSAVILIPYLDGYRYTARDTLPDLVQRFSQPIHYGLMNYMIHTPEWFNATVLGTAGGWNWFNIGWLPVFALVFVPWTFHHSPRKRWPMLASGILFLILMMWFANRFPPFKQIYDWIPFLYTFRFPNRLLIIATSPLLILSAHALEIPFRSTRTITRDIRLLYWPSQKNLSFLSARHLMTLIWLVILVMTTKGVYDVNKSFTFVDQNLNPKSFAALRWLKEYDSSLYYVNLGDKNIYWDWTPAAYTLEMPVINFQYNRHLRSQERQSSESSPFIARAKYYFSLPDQPIPENAQQIREFEGLFVWIVPDILPYAFSVQPAMIQEYTKLTVDQVTALDARINGPNQVIVKGAPSEEGEALVVLMSYYPGWKLLIDGKPAAVTAYNGYLGAKMPPGKHSYVFYFLPVQYVIGTAISVITVLLMVFIALAPLLRTTLLRFRQHP
jgi:hypothetical protein